jgi:uncharacterized protein with PIN domain
MKASSILVSCLGFLTLHSANAESFKAAATLKLEKRKEVGAAEVEAFLNQVKSRSVLDEIAVRLALGQAWKLDGEQTAARLAGVLEVSVNGQDGTIIAEDDSPVMSAILANTAASVLKDRGDKTGGKSMGKFNETVQEQEESVRQKRANLSKIIREQGVVYQGKEEFEAKEMNPIAAQGFVDAKKDFETAQRLLEDLKKKQAELENDRFIGVHHVIWAKAPEK